MSEAVEISKDLSEEEKYVLLLKQVKSLLNKDDNIISNLSNLVAVIKQSFSKVSWAGFYLFDGEKLYLGPFQGKVACTTIMIGKGVCGTSAQKEETIVVPDVNEFKGHIFCDPDSRSEIVIPIIKNNVLFGVLDLDSNSFNSFNEADKKYLEEVRNFMVEEII